jgi:hypothetical protein
MPETIVKDSSDNTQASMKGACLLVHVAGLELNLSDRQATIYDRYITYGFATVSTLRLMRIWRATLPYRLTAFLSCFESAGSLRLWL